VKRLVARRTYGPEIRLVVVSRIAVHVMHGHHLALGFQLADVDTAAASPVVPAEAFQPGLGPFG
jgi:hypothetical protein